MPLQYAGVKGQGSYLTKGVNSRPLKLPLSNPPKPLPSLSQALIGTGIPLAFYSILLIFTPKLSNGDLIETKLRFRRSLTLFLVWPVIPRKVCQAGRWHILYALWAAPP